MHITKRQKYIQEYYERNYGYALINGLDEEIKAYGNFLITNIKGKTLDFGCGPSIHFNALFMPNATLIDGIDITPENITFTKAKIKSFAPESYKKIEGFIRKSGIKKYSTSKQIRKIRHLIVSDFTKKIPRILKPKSYDSVVSTFSIGCLRTVEGYESAIKNMFNLTKKGGRIIILNTNGMNANQIVPEITYNGLELANKSHTYLQNYLKKLGCKNVRTKTVRIEPNLDEMYKHSKLFLTHAEK